MYDLFIFIFFNFNNLNCDILFIAQLFYTVFYNIFQFLII